jgi:hypothetical protein
VGLHQCPSEKQGQTKSGRSQLVPLSRPEPGPDRRRSRDFGRQRPRDPAETDSAAEERRFEPPVPLGRESAGKVERGPAREGGRKLFGKAPVLRDDRRLESLFLHRLVGNRYSLRISACTISARAITRTVHSIRSSTSPAERQGSYATKCLAGKWSGRPDRPPGAQPHLRRQGGVASGLSFLGHAQGPAVAQKLGKCPKWRRYPSSARCIALRQFLRW